MYSILNTFIGSTIFNLDPLIFLCMWIILFPYLIVWGFKEPHRYSNLSDEALVNLYQKDHHLLIIAILIQRHSHQLAILQYSFLKDSSQFNDFAHELFNRLAEELKTVHIRSTFQQWLIWWVKNRLIDHSRRKRTSDKVYSNWAIKQEIKEFPNYEEKMDYASFITEAMAMLNDDEKFCLTQYYLEDQTYNDIALKRGWKFKKVANHIARARDKLRAKLGDKIEAYFQ